MHVPPAPIVAPPLVRTGFEGGVGWAAVRMLYTIQYENLEYHLLDDGIIVECSRIISSFQVFTIPL